MSEHKTTEMLNQEAEKVWAGIKDKTLTNAERGTIPAQEMPSRDPIQRAREMGEVALGYTETQARVEAERCLGCAAAPCTKGCPVNVPIKDFIAHIQKGDFKGAVDTINKGVTGVATGVTDTLGGNKN